MSKPEIPQKYPYVVDTEPGHHAWCACGRSVKQPFCDGRHKDVEIKPIVVEVKEQSSLAWCGCKHTKNPPYCDGSHKNL